MGNFELKKTGKDLLVLKKDFIDFAVETEADGIHLGDVNLMKTNLEQYFIQQENHSKGKNLPDGWIPHTRYWGISQKQKLIGSIDIRHSLTDCLKDFGGNIGYIIRPAERNKGFATLMLAEILNEARKLGLQKVLLTAAVENIASRRVIEKNNGILEKEKYSQIAECLTAYYWIHL